MMIWTYDEWGGWYDHVPPPAAIPPDDVPPDLPPNQEPGRLRPVRFRVPAGVVSPYARRDYVSHTIYDHTSVLKTLERKWNLPALTRRDANANDVFDMVDLKAPPSFARPPTLKAPANPTLSEMCLETGPGTIPPRRAVKLGAVPGTPVIGASQPPRAWWASPDQYHAHGLVSRPRCPLDRSVRRPSGGTRAGPTHRSHHRNPDDIGKLRGDHRGEPGRRSGRSTVLFGDGGARPDLAPEVVPPPVATEAVGGASPEPPERS